MKSERDGTNKGTDGMSKGLDKKRKKDGTKEARERDGKRKKDRTITG